MSPPAQKARSPAPRIRTAWTLGPSSHCRSIGANARYIPRVKALSACGRFRVMVASPPSRPNRMSFVSATARFAFALYLRRSWPGLSWPSPAMNDFWTGCRLPNLQREDQQGIDLLAVEDDQALDRAERRGADVDT